MSIIIFATLENKGQPVKRVQIPVGWHMPEPAAFRRDVIWEIMLHDKLAKERLPAFDKVSVTGDDLVEIDGGIFSAPFSFRSLLRQGADRETVLKLVSDHRDALAALDRRAYTDAQTTEWNDAGIAITILFDDLTTEGSNAR